MINCSICKSKDIVMHILPNPFKPVFECNCGNEFNYGMNGGKYAKYCRLKESKRKAHEKHYVVEVLNV